MVAELRGSAVFGIVKMSCQILPRVASRDMKGWQDA